MTVIVEGSSALTMTEVGGFCGAFFNVLSKKQYPMFKLIFESIIEIHSVLNLTVYRFTGRSRPGRVVCHNLYVIIRVWDQTKNKSVRIL